MLQICRKKISGQHIRVFLVNNWTLVSSTAVLIAGLQGCKDYIVGNNRLRQQP
jgi:hypothetical protein